MLLGHLYSLPALDHFKHNMTRTGGKYTVLQFQE